MVRLKEIAKVNEEPATDHLAVRVGKSVKNDFRELVEHYGKKTVAKWLRQNIAEFVRKEHGHIRKPA